MKCENIIKVKSIYVNNNLNNISGGIIMAFCTECGFKLPDDAVFCPNCGTSMTAAAKKTAVPSEITPEKPAESVYSAPESASLPVEQKEESPQFQTSGAFSAAPPQVNPVPPASGTYTPPASGAYTPPYGTYTPPAAGAYTPPVPSPPPPAYQGGYTPQPQNQYQQPNPYGYTPYQGGVGVNTMPPKKSKGGLIAIIAVAAVVVIAVALILILKPFGGSPYVGYWEVVSADLGDGNLVQEDAGGSLAASLALQINSDGSAYIGSSYYEGITDGTWEESDDGISVTGGGLTQKFVYEHKKLVLEAQGIIFYLEKVKGDINNPTVPFGSLAGAQGLETAGSDEQTANVAGSGYVGNSDFYITVTGAEDIIDVDGDPAIRIYYDFTNCYYDHYSLSAYDNLGYYATQDGSDLYETYYDDTTVNNCLYNIRPDITIQCWAEFKCDPSGGNIDFAIYGYDDGEDGGVVYATFDPNNLPGPPAPYVVVPVTDPQWTTQLPETGDLEGIYVEVGDAESVTDANGYAAVRVYYQFTNNTTYDTSFYEETYTYAYQDGISLETTYETVDSDTDTDYYTTISPGQTITVSCVFKLRNQTSPIEAEVESYSGESAVGATYYF